MQDEPRNTDVSIHNWMGTQLLLVIPGVNLIMLIVWSFSARTRSKRNFAISALILTFIFIALCWVALAFFGTQIVDWLAKLNSTSPTVVS